MPNNSVPFKKKAKDGDADGVLQDGTMFERPESVNGDYGKTAIFSSRSIYWEGVGRIKRGYNIVNNKFLESWLSLDGIRVATVKEVAREYNL